MLNRITILGSGYFEWFYDSNHFPVCIYSKVSCCNLKHMQFLLINKVLINWKYCLFYLVAAYLELMLFPNTFFSRKWDVFSSSFLEQSPVLFRIVWNWGPGISLSCLTTASELLSFWVMWKLQLCLQTAGRGLHCHLSSSLLFCCIFNHLGDGYSDFPTIWLNVFLSRSYLILIIVAKFSLNRVVKP